MTGNPTLLNAFKAALDHETNPADPLSTVSADSIDEYLSRLNEDFAQGRFVLTPEKQKKMIDLYRAQAANWEMEEQAKKPRAKKGAKKEADLKPALDLSDFTF